MKGMDRLITKGDIRKAVEVIAGTVKRRKIIHALTIGPPDIVTDITDNGNESDGDGSLPTNEQELARGFIMKYTLDTNGLPCGWLDLKPSFMDSKYIGNVSELWKAWHDE
jgi:actin-like ATPase involved in cell morphogenesis